MTSRFRLILVVGALTVAGCGDAFNAGPLKYVESPRIESELKEQPKMRDGIRQGLAKLFGDDPQHISVPTGMGLPLGGARLAGYVKFPDGKEERFKLPVSPEPGQAPVNTVVRGGYTVYREHCLHCHGVSGAGDGPTAPFLFPRPRDYRKGIFKFTSTANGQEPTRDDLKKTIQYGLHGTSMPAFESLMSDFEIDQVIDYVIFLSIRGKVEDSLIDEAKQADESDPEALGDQVLAGIVKGIANKWKTADTFVLNPPVPRHPASRDSILRGRDLFLQRDPAKHKLECMGCHGPLAQGNGPSFINQDIFNEVVFGGNPSTRDERLKELALANAKKRMDVEAAHHVEFSGDLSDPAKRLERYVNEFQKKWDESKDEWGDPLRPANLNRGVYKGGRRPLDIYWRIAKGINGAKMPAHDTILKPNEIWDLVNFVLTLPYEPELLTKAGKIEFTPPETKPKSVANR